MLCQPLTLARYACEVSCLVRAQIRRHRVSRHVCSLELSFSLLAHIPSSRGVGPLQKRATVQSQDFGMGIARCNHGKADPMMCAAASRR